MANDVRLFVCGSYSSGMVHYKRIEEFVADVSIAHTKGSVYRLEVGFPVFSNDGTEMITGEVITLKNSEVLLKLVDEFFGYSVSNKEKSLFHRIPIDVETMDGPLSVQTYVINPLKLPKTAKVIANGDWKKDLEVNPPLTITLTERQVTYIKKLGASSGRDIVPINLDLYRELLNKGLILDKGRRLALTKLGQEAYRYLE